MIPPVISEPVPLEPDLYLLDSEGTVDAAGFLTVSGHVKNPGKAHRYAQIEFTVYDDDGSQVGTAMANILGLEAGATWAFSAVCIERGGTKFKLRDINAH